eukprot:CAMPEP_0184687086 /NCGR_PEP_ID=MMETSP0312-20130426/25060_1 /TAXON_ID=31354 /ORGANISM="Compsopogon coeruleus, Strain SAG 36.94" /LENGTH=313 /DNA_ID=CAMNT_0027142821 /DNA_START=198 /DNA_END=1140 /DNA_ORIENTATION=-
MVVVWEIPISVDDDDDVEYDDGSVVLAGWKGWGKRGFRPVAETANEHEMDEQSSSVELSREMLLSYIMPIGACVALEIGCSNWAMELLTVSFGTILKGSAPVFVLLWGFCLGVESFSWPLLISIVLISGGIAVAAFGEVDFVLVGFILQITAVALGGFRWALIHHVLQGSTSMTPLQTTLYTAPTTAVFLLPVAGAVEFAKVTAHFTEVGLVESFQIVGVLVLIGSLVFLLLLVEYTLVRDTSSLTLSVAGVFKELVTIFGGVLFFHDHISLLNWLGFLIANAGIGLYLTVRHHASIAHQSYGSFLDEDDPGQ